MFVADILKLSTKPTVSSNLGQNILEQCFLTFKKKFIANFLRSSYIRSAHVSLEMHPNDIHCQVAKLWEGDPVMKIESAWLLSMSS